MRAPRGLVVLAVLVLIFGASSPAYAHGFASEGLLHPLTGLDHTIAMIAVGAWSAQRGGRAIYLVPAAFVGAMAVGGVAGILGAGWSGVELAIAASVLALGVAIASDAGLSWRPAALVTLAFGFVHGYSHGAEMLATTNPTTSAHYILGFLVTTAALHVIGAVSAALILEEQRGRARLRLAGAATAVVGLVLALQSREAW